MSKIPWSSAPVVRFILPFIMGIFCGISFQSAIQVLPILIIPFTLIGLLIYFFKKNIYNEYTWGFLFFTAAFITGIICSSIQNQKLRNNYFGKFLKEESLLR